LHVVKCLRWQATQHNRINEIITYYVCVARIIHLSEVVGDRQDLLQLKADNIYNVTVSLFKRN